MTQDQHNLLATPVVAPAETLNVDLGERSYDIHIGAGLCRRVVELLPPDLSQNMQGRSVFILTDRNVENRHAVTVRNALEQAGVEDIHMLVLEPGEATKSFAELERVLNWMLDRKVRRDSIFFAVGGGVIGDLGGFAASIVLRGIPYVQVPTTLLAQVDSAVGGKTAIDTAQGKNLVGTFYQPRVVICDTDSIKTLPQREVKAGYAEVVKYGLINRPEFFVWLEQHGRDICMLEDDSALTEAIKISCQAKAEIVAADEQESGMRALLNLGHTFGHAMERHAGFDGRLLHGEAVATGTVMAFALSVKMGLCPEEDLKRVEAHFNDTGLPTRLRTLLGDDIPPAETLAEYMLSDKKMTKSGLTFILVKGIGQAYRDKNVDFKDVTAVIADLTKE